MKKIIASVVILFLILIISGCNQKKYTVFHNGPVLTMDESALSESAMAVIIQDQKIVSLQPYSSIGEEIFHKAEIVDLKGNLLMPGIIESHGHLYGAAMLKIGGILRETLSKEDTLAWLSQEAERQKKKDWIVVRGWDQTDWSNQEFPTAKDIDALIPDRPVFFTRIGGHSAWLNSAALEAAGISADSEDPDGGIIVRDEEGNPTGILIDNAIPPAAELAIRGNGINPLTIPSKIQEAVYENGITTFNDMAMPSKAVPLMKFLYFTGIMKLNVRMHLQADDDLIPYLDRKKPAVLSEGRLEVASVKIFADGAMGSYGALLHEPYYDNPGTSGIQTIDDDLMLDVMKKARDRGYQVAVHAIGDLANSKTLDSFEMVIGDDSAGKYRWKIEHAQALLPEDIPRFGENGYIASMQPRMATSDMKWVVSRLGVERAETTYPWRSLLKGGAILTGGSDTPIEVLKPFWGMYAAETRQDEQGYPAGGFNPEEKMSREEALKMYTVWGAWASFREDRIGRIRVGFDADLIILDRDISRVPSRELLKTKVQATYQRGELVYSRDK